MVVEDVNDVWKVHVMSLSKFYPRITNIKLRLNNFYIDETPWPVLSYILNKGEDCKYNTIVVINKIIHVAISRAILLLLADKYPTSNTS